MNKKIIVAALNWGLGHASRCVPIIHFLLENKLTPIIASDGQALVFLQKEFPCLESLELPSYNISYTKNLKIGLLLKVVQVFKSIKKEQQVIADFIAERNDIVGIISDNRFGVRNSNIPSIYITHQINVLSDFTTFITSRLHQKIIRKFDECWVPDLINSEFSGKLSKIKKSTLNLKYIGVLSRFHKKEIPKKNDLLIILSGIDSQRKSLEKKILYELKRDQRSIVIVQGIIENKQQKSVQKNITIYNYLLSEELEKEVNQSEIIICRSGYSSIMDLAILQKKGFFIPTKNQNEQEYLAMHLQKQNKAPFCSEKNFTVDKLKQVNNYKGLSTVKQQLDESLLSLFKSK